MIQKQIVVLLLSIQALLLGWMGWSMCPNKTEVGGTKALVLRSRCSLYGWYSSR
jgi:hypothetical protein